MASTTSIAFIQQVLAKKSSGSTDVFEKIKQKAQDLNENDRREKNPLADFLSGLHPIDRVCLDAVCREIEESTKSYSNSVWQSPLADM